MPVALMMISEANRRGVIGYNNYLSSVCYLSYNRDSTIFTRTSKGWRFIFKSVDLFTEFHKICPETMKDILSAACGRIQGLRSV